MLLLKKSLETATQGKVTSKCVSLALKQLGGNGDYLPSGNLLTMSARLGYPNVGFTRSAKQMLQHYQQMGGRWPEEFTHLNNMRSSEEESARAEEALRLVVQIKDLCGNLGLGLPRELADFLDEQDEGELSNWVLKNLDRKKSGISDSAHTSQVRAKLPKFSTTVANVNKLKILVSFLKRYLQEPSSEEDDDRDSDYVDDSPRSTSSSSSSDDDQPDTPMSPRSPHDRALVIHGLEPERHGSPRSPEDRALVAHGLEQERHGSPRSPEDRALVPHRLEQERHGSPRTPRSPGDRALVPYQGEDREPEEPQGPGTLENLWAYYQEKKRKEHEYLQQLIELAEDLKDEAREQGMFSDSWFTQIFKWQDSWTSLLRKFDKRAKQPRDWLEWLKSLGGYEYQQRGEMVELIRREIDRRIEQGRLDLEREQELIRQREEQERHDREQRRQERLRQIGEKLARLNTMNNVSRKLKLILADIREARELALKYGPQFGRLLDKARRNIHNRREEARIQALANWYDQLTEEAEERERQQQQHLSDTYDRYEDMRLNELADRVEREKSKQEKRDAVRLSNQARRAERERYDRMYQESEGRRLLDQLTDQSHQAQLAANDKIHQQRRQKDPNYKRKINKMDG